MILLNLDKCFSCKKCYDVEPGLYSIIERGIRMEVCRHCINPPCVSACPMEALERPKDSDLIRYKMKCVSCKQCASACPVGANPFEILKYRTYPAYKLNIEKCKEICDEDAIKEIDIVQEGWIKVDDNFAVTAKDWK